MTLREILNSVISRLEKEYDLHLGLGEKKILRTIEKGGHWRCKSFIKTQSS